ncbi:DinB family protein [Lutimonas sp.]|uniref:DinB family protein n=1 Tax=Lutimonas sp. TaxID=1872403 RepID=UPI003D9AD697
MKTKSTKSRRNFLKKTSLIGTGIGMLPLMSYANNPAVLPPDNMYLIGPREGYSPQVGTLLSTMTMMRAWLVRSVKDLSIEELDFQIDDKSNSIGAMLLHLAATERYYQLNTFNDMKWGSWSDEIKKEWDVPMNLGEKGRQEIQGNSIDYYLNKLAEVRAETEKEFAKRDDEWVMKSEPFFGDLPTNNYCKWFHVCEHESNHRGQIKFIMKRMPAA